MKSYRVVILPRAEKELGRLPTHDAARVVRRLELLGRGLQGDVRKLTEHSPEYRLRVGDYRVLFDIDGDQVLVQTIRNRRDAYD